MSQSIEEQIAASVNGIADLIKGEAMRALERVRAVSAEAVSRIQLIVPIEEFSFEEAAQYLAMSKRTLDRRARQRVITYRRDGGRRIFTKTALDEYRKAGTVQAVTGRPLSL